MLITPIYPDQPWYLTLSFLAGQSEITAPISRSSNESPRLQNSEKPTNWSHDTSQTIVLKCRNLRYGYFPLACFVEKLNNENFNSSWRNMGALVHSIEHLSPLSDVLNLLTFQFHQGKLYRSLNGRYYELHVSCTNMNSLPWQPML